MTKFKTEKIFRRRKVMIFLNHLTQITNFRKTQRTKRRDLITITFKRYCK